MIKIIEGNIVNAKTDFIIHQVNCQGVMGSGVAKALRDYDDSRSGWFDKKDLKNTTELIINREELPISGTMLRALMIQDKRREWMTFVNPKLHKMYDEIRSELMESINEN